MTEAFLLQKTGWKQKRNKEIYCEILHPNIIRSDTDTEWDYLVTTSSPWRLWRFHFQLQSQNNNTVSFPANVRLSGIFSMAAATRLISEARWPGSPRRCWRAARRSGGGSGTRPPGSRERPSRCKLQTFQSRLLAETINWTCAPTWRLITFCWARDAASLRPALRLRWPAGWGTSDRLLDWRKTSVRFLQELQQNYPYIGFILISLK